MTVRQEHGQFRADLVYVGWQPADPQPAPGPPPRSVAPMRPDEISQDWLTAQRREYRKLVRPVRLLAATGLAAGLAGLAAAAAGVLSRPLAVAAVLAAMVVAAGSAGQLRRDGHALTAQLAAERDRVAAFVAAQRELQQALTQRHAQQVRAWQQRRAAHGRAPVWRPVTLPAAVRRVDVAGGTLAGWSALVTMLGAPRLASGGRVSVVDLTDGAVAADLLAVARRCGIRPQVLVLPADLQRLPPGTDLGTELLAEVLALTVSAADGPGGPASSAAADPGRDPARDAALLSRVLQALGDRAGLPALLAALRVLGQIGAPAQQLGSAELTASQLASLSTLAGRGAERLVIERAWAIEARLRALAGLGAAPDRGPARGLQVTWLDRRAAAVGNTVLAAYVVAELTARLRQSPPGRPWQQTFCLLGAERLPGEALDRLSDAAECAGAGLVLAYRSIPLHVRDRLGRGNAALAFMRLGNAEDARLAAEQIGTEHRFVVSQLTESVGDSVTGTSGDTYTSTAGTADSVAGSASVTLTDGRSRGHGRGRPDFAAPFAAMPGTASREVSRSAAASRSASITEGVNAATSWGLSTSAAIGSTSSLARTVQRSREFVVEQHELQHLPHSAVLLCYPAPGGRQVVLADANPAIMALPTASFSDGRHASADSDGDGTRPPGSGVLE